MTQNERLEKIEKKINGNGKRGLTERLGRLEVVCIIILGLQISILIKLFL